MKIVGEEKELARAYWKEVQSPATRSKDPLALLNQATQALETFSHPHIRASALCVIIYRYLENKQLRADIARLRLQDHVEQTSRELETPKDLQTLRWGLSLNMAQANLMVLEGRPNEAVVTLLRNVEWMELALAFGQPFTNVVKSVCAVIGVAKHFKPEPFTDEKLAALLRNFSTLGPRISQNYKYENYRAYSELEGVYRNVFALAKLNHLAENRSSADTLDLLHHFEDKSIPSLFLNAIREVKNSST
jgi:hypothetical protein